MRIQTIQAALRCKLATIKRWQEEKPYHERITSRGYKALWKQADDLAVELLNLRNQRHAKVFKTKKPEFKIPEPDPIGEEIFLIAHDKRIKELNA